MGRSWTLHIPAPCQWLTANRNAGRYGQGRLVKQWREASFTAAKAARLPTGLARVRIDAIARFAGRPPVRDLFNLAPTIKAAVDGLGPAREFTRNGKRYRSVGYGLIPDDDDKHLEGPYPALGEPLPARPYGPVGELILLIREVTDGPANHRAVPAHGTDDERLRALPPDPGPA